MNENSVSIFIFKNRLKKFFWIKRCKKKNYVVLGRKKRDENGKV